MKLSNEKALALFAAIRKARLTGLTTDGKRDMIRSLRSLRRNAGRWSEFADEAVSRMSKAEADAAILEELRMETDVDIYPVGEEAVMTLMEANPEWTAEMADIADECFGQTQRKG